MEVEWINIPESEAIASVRYFPDDHDLEITFQGGSIYLYHRVPPAEADGFSTTDSAGTYFREHILNRYSFTRLK